jgi:tRNA(Ile)-lysidine synthase
LIQGPDKEHAVLHPLEHTIRRTLLAESPPIRGRRVLVGVSGGADSMALLHILAALRSEFCLHLVVAHVDHGLRPSEAPAEWVCVQEAALRLGIDCVRAAVDVHAAAAARKLSLEHAARELRYRAFADAAGQWATELLAVAHTADDQAEEVLLRLLRGGGRKALSGMRLQAGDLIRPLLGIRKAELLAYLGDLGIGYCVDSSNDDVRFLRNRVRNHLLPLLEEHYDPGVRSALLKTASNLREDEDLLENLLDECWGSVVTAQQTPHPELADHRPHRLDRAAFCRLHPALQRRLVEKLLWSLSNVAQYEQIVAVLAAAVSGRNGGELHLSRGLRVVVGRDFLEFSYPQGKGPWRGRLPAR